MIRPSICNVGDCIAGNARIPRYPHYDRCIVNQKSNKMQNEKFDLWCIVELFGHSKIAGRCTEQNIAGTNMLRVDVPETKTHPAFTRLFGSAAIYAINPVDETTARYTAERLELLPIESWRIEEVIKKHQDKLLLNGASDQAGDDDLALDEIDTSDDEENGW